MSMLFGQIYIKLICVSGSLNDPVELLSSNFLIRSLNFGEKIARIEIKQHIIVGVDCSL